MEEDRREKKGHGADKREIRKELRQLRKRQNELTLKQQELPHADRKRMEALKFETDLGEFQVALLLCEEQQWKDIKADVERLKRQREAFNGFTRIVRTLLDSAYIERQILLEESWPGLAPVKVKDVDLLACAPDKAEETVATLLKPPDSQSAGRKDVRHIRMLAESYRIQQRLFHLVYERRIAINPETAPSWGSQVDFLLGMNLPEGGRRTDKDGLDVQFLLEALRSYSQVKRRLLQTWIDYQMLRLDLYGALGVAPPER